MGDISKTLWSIVPSIIAFGVLTRTMSWLEKPVTTKRKGSLIGWEKLV